MTYMIDTPRIALSLMLVSIVVVWISTNRYSVGQHAQLIIRKGKLRFLFSLMICVQLIWPELLSFPTGAQFLIIKVFGLLLAGVGVAFAVWAKFAMKKNWGEPGQHDRTEQNELVTTGPYKYSRNPIYVGLFLYVLGLEMAMASYVIVLIVPLSMGIHKVVMKEERLLSEIFGEQFLGYQKRTRRYL